MIPGTEHIPFDQVPLNHQLVDTWSLVHLATGAAMGWIMHPVLAIILMMLYEPFEIFVLFPFMYQNFGIVFGNESLINSLSDIVVNCAGVAVGYYVLRKRYPPPFTLFEKTPRKRK